MIEDRPFNLDELCVRTHRLAIELPVEYNDYFTQVIEAIGRLESEIQTRADLCAQLAACVPFVPARNCATGYSG